MKNTKEIKKNTMNLDEQINRPFENDENLLHMAWSMAAYAQLDPCSPVYVLM